MTTTATIASCQRMKNPALVIPEAMDRHPGPHRLDPERRRGREDARARPPAGEPDQRLQFLRRLRLAGAARRPARASERLFAVAAWRESPYFNDAERAALALAECVTRLADRPDPVPDEVWDEAARHFDEAGLSALLLMIATTNVFNRLNVATRQPAGSWS